MWMRTLSDVENGTSSKQCNEAFLQVQNIGSISGGNEHFES